MEGVKKSGFLEKLLGSRVNTTLVSWKEKYLGHLIGPLGLIFIINTIAALVEKYFTQQVSLFYGGDPLMTSQMGNIYEGLMTGAKIGSTLFGVLIGLILEKIPPKYGRFRPVYYIVGWISLACGFLIFLFPGTTLGDAYWYYFFLIYIVYLVIGQTYFYLFRDNIVSLSTHNKGEKTQLTFIRKLSWTLVSGILIGLIVSTVIVPFWLDKDINGYPILMVVLSIISIPLFLLEYYYTKERVLDEEVKEGKKDINKIPVLKQFRALLSSKYFLLLFILTTAQLVVDNFKGGNVQYFYIKFLLGGDENGAMFSIYQIVTGVPLGIGAFLVYPLAKKFGVRNVCLVGYSLFFIGSLFGYLFPDNVAVAYIFGFIRQLGQLPNAYIFFTLVLFGYDHVEFKAGFRAEGLFAASIFNAIAIAISAPFAGGYESTLLKMGFVDAPGVTPSQEIIDFMGQCFYLFDLGISALYIIILLFINIEKKMDFINLELLRRRKEECLEKGEVWIEPEEKERLEKIEQDRLYEEARINDLKARCEKKGLDFETENNKYLLKKKEKEEKERIKALKKEEKKNKKIKS